MIGERSIRSRMVFYLLSTFLVFFLAIFGCTYFYFRNMMMQAIETNAKNIAAATASKIESVLNRVEAVPQTIAGNLNTTAMTQDEILSFLRAAIERNPEIFGTAVAFEPGMFDPARVYFAPYCHRSANGPEVTYLGGDSYKYFLSDWYQIPKETGRPDWSEPYYDRGGAEILMTTYSVPFFLNRNGQRVFGGVVTADVSLSWLQKIVSSIRIGKTGYGFVISGTGRFVVHPLENLIMNETVFSLAEQSGNQMFRRIGKRMVQGESGYVKFEKYLNGEKCWLVYVSLPFNGWSFGAIFPRDELLADLGKLNGVVLGLGAGGLLVLLVLILFISQSVTSGLRKLSEVTGVIALGNLDFEMPHIFGKDEVGRLARSVVSMRDSLKEHIRQLTEATTARERVESELRIAREIQQSLFPRQALTISGFEVIGWNKPATETGGDYYDWCKLPSEEGFVMLGDATGHGLGPALLIASCRAYVRADLPQNRDLSGFMSRLNERLSDDTSGSRYVTFVGALIDEKKGQVKIMSAGHCPSLLVRSGTDQIEQVKAHGVPLGVMPGQAYPEVESVQLQKGDRLVVYTDGITEAKRANGEMFGTERLVEAILRHSNLEGQAFIDALHQELSEFLAGIALQDDLTILSVRKL